MRNASQDSIKMEFLDHLIWNHLIHANPVCTDDFSRYGYVYLMKYKSETFEMFKELKNEVQNQLGKSMKAIESDRGGEYLSLDFDDYLKVCGIVSQLIVPGTPQWNGVSERRNRTLLHMVQSMMSQADLSTSF